MGYRTTNYKKKSGVTLPTAYAMISKLEVGRISTVVELKINESRDKIHTHGADEIIYVTVPTDEVMLEHIYKKMKEPIKTIEFQNIEVDNVIKTQAVEVEVPNVFTGWEDDIVKE